MLKTIKIARTEKELKDVFKLRYQVYVKQEGYFKDVSTKLITDQFDSTLQTANVIAYSGIQPIATIRINCDSEILLPCDEKPKTCCHLFLVARACWPSQSHGVIAEMYLCPYSK